MAGRFCLYSLFKLAKLCILKRNFSTFRYLGARVPFHPACKIERLFVGEKILSDQPVLMLRNVIFQKLMRNNDIFSDQLAEGLYIIPSEFTVVCNHFKREIVSRNAGLTLTISAVFVGDEVSVK